ncbi:hypothetical protein PENSPDRAFT_709416 [Peniophora sp. CONT]|nr:hypothetical protein PENSPDRAFT_709416 [Peniophora sp. CONT]
MTTSYFSDVDLDAPVDLDFAMAQLDPDYVPTPVVDVEAELRAQAELKAAQDLEYAQSMIQLQWMLHNAVTPRVAPAPLRERVNLVKWQLYEMPEQLKSLPVPAPVKPAMDYLQVPKANVKCTQKLDVVLDPRVVSAAACSLGASVAQLLSEAQFLTKSGTSTSSTYGQPFRGVFHIIVYFLRPVQDIRFQIFAYRRTSAGSAAYSSSRRTLSAYLLYASSTVVSPSHQARRYDPYYVLSVATGVGMCGEERGWPPRLELSCLDVGVAAALCKPEKDKCCGIATLRCHLRDLDLSFDATSLSRTSATRNSGSPPALPAEMLPTWRICCAISGVPDVGVSSEGRGWPPRSELPCLDVGDAFANRKSEEDTCTQNGHASRSFSHPWRRCLAQDRRQRSRSLPRHQLTTIARIYGSLVSGWNTVVPSLALLIDSLHLAYWSATALVAPNTGMGGDGRGWPPLSEPPCLGVGTAPASCDEEDKHFLSVQTLLVLPMRGLLLDDVFSPTAQESALSVDVTSLALDSDSSRRRRRILLLVTLPYRFLTISGVQSDHGAGSVQH